MMSMASRASRLCFVLLALLLVGTVALNYMHPLNRLPDQDQNVVKFNQMQDALNRPHPTVKASGEFSFASYYGSHMVLQRAPKKAALWGYAPLQDKGKTVTVEVSSSQSYATGKYDKVYKTEVKEGPMNDTAIWWVQLDAVEDEGPYTIKASLASYNPVTLDDVLFGDVWICSGQSNMQFTTDMMFNATEELNNVHLYPKIRLFVAAEKTSDTPLYDLLAVQEQWSLPSKDTVGHGAWSYFSAVCWLYGKNLFQKLQRPIGLLETDWGGTPVEAWSSAAALRRCGVGDVAPEPSVFGPSGHSLLWNAMVHPLRPMTIYGAIWYQGEANAGAPDTYNCTFPAMISDWRKNFHEMSDGQTDPYFPFGFVQLAPNDPAPNVTSGWPDIRWHQTGDMGYVPNHRMHDVFMAVAMDLRDDTSPYGAVHPRDKITVGERLAAAGLAVAYRAHWLRFQGPFPQVLDKAGNTMTVHFDQEIMVKVKTGYEVCCSKDGLEKCGMSALENWSEAPITKSDTTSITLSTDACAGAHIVGVRYAWRETPCLYKECAVYSADGELPAPPYINMDIAAAQPALKTSTDFKFASYYGSHMVLQRAPKKAAVWGFAPMQDKGKNVTVEVSSTGSVTYDKVFHGEVKTGPMNDTAIWWVQLDAVEDEGPYTIKASLASYNPVTLDDVLFGDVWICSGQSNMEFPVAHMFHAAEELENAHLYPKVRFMITRRHPSDTPLYDVPGLTQAWTLPTNVTVATLSAVCWLYGKNISDRLQRPIGLVESDWGGTRDEIWSSPEALRTCGLNTTGTYADDPVPTQSSVLWNSMIHPFLPMTIYGAIWYQGEANTDKPDTYNCSFPAMINDWRKNFHIWSEGQTDLSFPFGFVQLAANDPASNATGGFPDIRWHQTGDVGYAPNQRLNRVFMAVAMDLRDDASPYGTIHPRYKIAVGQRLAAAGLAVAYHQFGNSSEGPFPRGLALDEASHTLRIVFDQEIEVRVKTGFEVCCPKDGTQTCQMSSLENWSEAPITKSDSKSVTLSFEECGAARAVGLRYAWRMTPCETELCAVYGTRDLLLPAPPYINMDIAEFKFASYYGSHMVLQRAPKKSAVWGYAPMQDRGKNVTVEVSSTGGVTYDKVFHGEVKTGPMDDTAIWWVQLDAVEDEGPYTIKASLASYNPVTLDDVLFGDVWICSGQSNMKFPAGNMFHAAEELENAHLYPKVRFMISLRHPSDTPLYDVPGLTQAWTLPTNVTVATFSAVCWLYGKNISDRLQRPVGLVESDWGGTRDEIWSSPEALRTCGLNTTGTYEPTTYMSNSPNALPVSKSMPDDPVPTQSSVLWNSLIHPFLPMTIYGAIWYQGEANAEANPDTYNCSFPAMINDWRKNFHIWSEGQTDPSFPFGFVQLAANDQAPNATGGYPDIRWHQTGDVGYAPNQRLHRVFMAVAMDLRDDASPYGTVHPRYKIPVGQRLAAAGLAVAYHQFGNSSEGPFPRGLVLDEASHTLRIVFDQEIEVRVKTGFEVCCPKDGTETCEMSALENWSEAPIKKSDSKSVTLSFEECGAARAVGVRYAWRMTPCETELCAVYGTRDLLLPAPPYINMNIGG